MRDDTQLTQEERYQIEALLKVGHPQSEIATVLKRHKSTISHEVGRNHGLRGYRSKQAQRLALVCREARAKPTYVTTARSSPTIRPSPRDSTPKATSLTPTIPGSVDSTRTPTGSSGSTCPRAPISTPSHTRRSAASWTGSTIGHENVLTSRFQISYPPESNHRLHLRVQSVIQNINS